MYWLTRYSCTRLGFILFDIPVSVLCLYTRPFTWLWWQTDMFIVIIIVCLIFWANKPTSIHNLCCLCINKLGSFPWSQNPCMHLWSLMVLLQVWVAVTYISMEILPLMHGWVDGYICTHKTLGYTKSPYLYIFLTFLIWGHVTTCSRYRVEIAEICMHTLIIVNGTPPGVGSCDIHQHGDIAVDAWVGWWLYMHSQNTWLH